MTKRYQYSEEDMKKALEATQNGMSIRKASACYNVPRSQFPQDCNHTVVFEENIPVNLETSEPVSSTDSPNLNLIFEISKAKEALQLDDNSKENLLPVLNLTDTSNFNFSTGDIDLNFFSIISLDDEAEKQGGLLSNVDKTTSDTNRTKNEETNNSYETNAESETVENKDTDREEQKKNEQKDENEVTEENLEDENKENTDKNNFIQEILEKSPVKKMEKLSNIPTPFKKIVFWITPPEEKKKQLRKPKEKTPSVVVSQLWQQYEKRKLDKKQNEQEEKDKRKKIRLGNKENKVAASKPKGEKKCIDPNEKTKRVKEVQKETRYLVGDYVIVKYNEACYPGCILNYNDENQEYTVKAMTPTGQNWKWPAREDILAYKTCDITRKIKKPKLINKRGVYEVAIMK